ncbi:MAG: hypothetical protein CVV32_08225 [Methanomicrobiales archaeon HGW-Methanomicrobiales-3]|jgi:hypothetical protein|nr:MAG: hypothetical protein CVV32_08225 [Methanomicrobiales archaeon HGW-Methanomicrobiales-3]
MPWNTQNTSWYIMAAKKEPGRAWRTTSVLVRADIFAQAQERGIDISDTCNQALADLLGVDYRQQQLDSVPVPPPVIIAKDGGVQDSVARAPQTSPRPPVINADDPKAAGTIATTRRQPAKKTAAPPPQEPPAPAPEKRPAEATKAAAPAPAPKGKRTAPKKAEKGDPIKKFIAAMIVREDDSSAVIAKEELYQIFSRWCREQKVSMVPDQKAVTVALKTRFAFTEKNAGGKPCWTNVRFTR